jgi:outer membrane lipoprotein SlyB
MRHIGLVVVLAVGLSLVGCESASSPSGTVKAWLKATEALDREKAESLTCQARRGESSLSLGLASAFGGGDLKMDYSGVDARTVSESGDHAVVRVSGTIKGSYQGQTSDLPMNGDIDVVKEDGAWRVCGSS